MLRYDTRGDASWLTLDRPEKKNALHLDGWYELHEGLERAADESRVAVLTGVEDVFCAGDDISLIDDAETAADVEELTDSLYDVLFGIESLDVPVIAAVNGLAYGGGCELVAACDLAVAVEDATFALPETKIGAYPPYVVERVAETVGKKRLMELALTGDPIGAETAADWGLVNRVVSADQLTESVTQFVESIAASPRRSTALTKQNATIGAASPGTRERIRGSFQQIRADDDCRAATRRFFER
ncbi:MULTISPECIES: enoyl-CoA hydratase/isomerase family protein [Haloferax]|uniref:Enoyl-CoA hydratase n=1 Tax=Haloferax marinum TaxID=2666143 RepID=A0A6A8G6D1_9EURY|nr:MULTISPECIES: enoyl-CoA hydratase/isomerase family protein [Haloferax]KAB1197642.1 enoyl-CoA hydratase/isomerase family protein [Haloferax sp. CBA1150]MRW96694.1 enoyl-CoA hydratase [Haloferax marinum]